MGRDAPGRWGPPSEEIEIFATGSTVVRARSGEPAFETWHPPAGLDSAPAETRTRSARGYHARAGHRPGGAAPPLGSVSVRQGRPTDIVRPIFVDPTFAAALVTDGAVLERLPHIEVLEPDGDTDQLLSRPLVVIDRLHRSIEARLHVRASPSMVVTVLELMPTCRLRLGRRRFVERSVESVDVLARRIEREARRSGDLSRGAPAGRPVAP